MNKERIAKLAEVIEADQEHFNMEHWFHVPTERVPTYPYVKNVPQELKCGTTMCIAGWACFLWGAEADQDTEVDIAAADILGITWDQANTLFYVDDEVAIDTLKEWSSQ